MVISLHKTFKSFGSPLLATVMQSSTGVVMDATFWHQRWQENQIGFHQREINFHLQQFWPELGLAADIAVFVPLCGKSADMLWLRARGHRVIGVELSQIAVDAFFAENHLTASVRQEGEFRVSECDGIRIYCGDFFALQPADLAGVGAVFDRAALIALPPAMRRDYVAQMRRLLAPGAATLLVAFDYPQQEMQGPPFSVEEAEVRALYAPDHAVTLLHRLDILGQEPRFREKGLTRLHEMVYRLRYNSRSA